MYKGRIKMTVVEKTWMTKSGLQAVVLRSMLGHLCGYVAVKKDHPLYGVGYSDTSKAIKPIKDDERIGKRGIMTFFCLSEDRDTWTTPGMAFDVHGSLTYSDGGRGYPVSSDDSWWFGFDCAHHGDRTPYHPYGKERTLEFVEGECESLASQLLDSDKVEFRLVLSISIFRFKFNIVLPGNVRRLFALIQRDVSEFVTRQSV